MSQKQAHNLPTLNSNVDVCVSFGRTKTYYDEYLIISEVEFDADIKIHGAHKEEGTYLVHKILIAKLFLKFTLYIDNLDR